jgi:hypothetical protein
LRRLTIAARRRQAPSETFIDIPSDARGGRETHVGIAFLSMAAILDHMRN